MDITQGEVIVACGPSGSGKSTFIRCINHLEPIQAGEILFFGEPIDRSRKGLAKLRTKVGMVFQNFNDKSKSTPYGRGHRLTGYAC